jgi:protein-L-isoaspartate O-methyltransferase
MRRTHADLIQSLVRQNIIKNERIKTAMLATDRLDFSTDRLYEDAPQPSNILLVVSEKNLQNCLFFQLVIM